MDTSPEATPYGPLRLFMGDVVFLCCVDLGFGPEVYERENKNGFGLDEKIGKIV